MKRLRLGYNAKKDKKPSARIRDIMGRDHNLPSVGSGITFMVPISPSEMVVLGGNVETDGRVYLMAWDDRLGGDPTPRLGRAGFWINFDPTSVTIGARLPLGTEARRLPHDVVPSAQSSSTYYDDVREFNERFRLPIDTGTPELLADTVFLDRYQYLLEELHELLRAHHTGDLVGFADALVDLVYFALGTAQFAHLPFDAIWDEVQRANMEKERAVGSDDSRASSGPRVRRTSADDVVKPEGWRPPDIEGILLRGTYEPARTV